MRNSKNKERCEKQSFGKCDGVCRTYSDLQLAYARQLDADPTIAKFQCNVPLPDFELTDGSWMKKLEDSLAKVLKRAA